MKDQIGIGVIGLGTAARLLLPAVRAHSGTRLVGVTDTVASIAESVAAEFNAKAFPDAQSLVRCAEVDAVYVATPTQLHVSHVELATAAHKHVLCEKPMAANITDCLKMIKAAERAGVLLLVGHSRSYEAPFQQMRNLIEQGTLGRVRMISQLSYTDWMRRPRRPDEFDAEQGGGVVFRQGAHQFDVVRFLAGGMAISVTATTFDWDPARKGIGAFTASVRFAQGAAGNIIYNGYGAFSSTELAGDIDETGFVDEGKRLSPVTTPRGAQEELAAKRALSDMAAKSRPPFHPAFGLTLVSCESGDLRQSPAGVFVYRRGGRSEIRVPLYLDSRTVVVNELHDAVQGISPPLHDGRWGLANVELCEAAMASSRLGREVTLHHQCALLARRST